VTFTSFLSLGLTFEPKSVGGRIYTAGLAFFLTVTGAAFTANTASFLLTEAMDDKGPQSLQDALDLGYRVCYTSSIFSGLVAQYPALSNMGVDCDSQENPVSTAGTLLAGKCDCALDTDVMFQWSWANGDLCEYKIVGDSLVQFLTGMYVSEKIHRWFSVGTAHKINDRTWSVIDSSMQSSACPDASSSTGDEQGANVLTPSHMIGNLGILAVCGIIALVLDLGFRQSSTARGGWTTSNSGSVEELPVSPRVSI